MTPKAAAIDSRFMIPAFRATSGDRNTVVSSRNDRSTTAPMNTGSRLVM
jgi:hypothetical protein